MSILSILSKDSPTKEVPGLKLLPCFNSAESSEGDKKCDTGTDECPNRIAILFGATEIGVKNASIYKTPGKGWMLRGEGRYHKNENWSYPLVWYAAQLMNIDIGTGEVESQRIDPTKYHPDWRIAWKKADNYNKWLQGLRK